MLAPASGLRAFAAVADREGERSRIRGNTTRRSRTGDFAAIAASCPKSPCSPRARGAPPRDSETVVSRLGDAVRLRRYRGELEASCDRFRRTRNGPFFESRIPLRSTTVGVRLVFSERRQPRKSLQRRTAAGDQKTASPWTGRARGSRPPSGRSRKRAARERKLQRPCSRIARKWRPSSLHASENRRRPPPPCWRRSRLWTRAWPV